MKTIKIAVVIMLYFITTGISAQASVNINLGRPPVWARAAPPATQFYYLPDIETYYDVPSRRYIYLRNGVWTRSASLPYRYRTYNLYNGRTVYLTDYRGKRPYTFYKQHKVKYVGNKNWKINNNKGNKKGIFPGNNNGNKKGVFPGNNKGNNKGNIGNQKGKGNGKGQGNK